MEILFDLASEMGEALLYPLSSLERFYWLYLCSALGLSVAVYAVTQRMRGGAMVRRTWHFLFPKSIYLHKSAVVDYKFFVVNRMSYALIFAPLVVGAPMVASWTVVQLGEIFETSGFGLVPRTGARVALTVCAILAFDGAIFVIHFLQHKNSVLWEFHKIHHSAEVLTPVTVYRFHPFDDILTGSFIAIMTGMVYGAFGFVFSYGVGEIQVNGLNFVLFLFYMTGANLRHSHIWLPYPRFLRHIFISPAAHQIHHSADPKHYDKNFGFIFAFWDWFAGTLYLPEGKEDLTLGLGGGEHREYNSVGQLYLLPFRKIAARWRPSQGRTP